MKTAVSGQALESEVRKILGYPDGDILTMVRRYHAYATSEIATLRRGGERLAAYCQKLQKKLPQETVMALGLEAVQTGPMKTLPPCDHDECPPTRCTRPPKYRLTDEELNQLLEASKPVPYMVFGGVEPRSPRDNAMDVWKRVASRVGCDVESIDGAGTGDQRDFIARSLEVV